MDKKDQIWEKVLEEQNVEPVEPAKKKSNVTDIYDGNILTSWDDEDFVYINFPFVCINIPKDMIHGLAHDLANLAEVLLDTYPPSEEENDDDDYGREE